MEPSLEGRVLLYVLPVLIQGGGSDTLEFPTREGGLEHVRGVHGTLGPAGTHQVMKLIDEENDLSRRLLDLVQNGFQALFELPPVLCARNEGPHVQGNDPFVPQALGDVAVSDPLCQSFGNCCLADARFTY